MPFARRLVPVVLLLALAALPGVAQARAPKPSWYSFAPYADVSDYPAPDLAAIGKAGVRAVSLGFVTARGGNACSPTWGGSAQYPASGRHAYLRSQVAAFRRAHRSAVVSFGGQAGRELATACSSASALTTAYQAAIAAYGATHVDFDVEGDALGNHAANARRAQAIGALQRAFARRHRRLAVSFTLPVEPSGLDSDGLSIVRGAVKARVAISVVNVMAMDYGDDSAPNPGGHMGDYAIESARALFTQLRRVYRQSSRAAVWRKVGVTPMLGINDVSSEVFTLADARQLAAWATHTHVGMLGMWSLGRDSRCDGTPTTTQDHCSGVEQAPWDFSRALGAFGG